MGEQDHSWSIRLCHFVLLLQYSLNYDFEKWKYLRNFFENSKIWSKQAIELGTLQISTKKCRDQGLLDKKLLGQLFLKSFYTEIKFFDKMCSFLFIQCSFDTFDAKELRFVVFVHFCGSQKMHKKVKIFCKNIIESRLIWLFLAFNFALRTVWSLVKSVDVFFMLLCTFQDSILFLEPNEQTLFKMNRFWGIIHYIGND